MRGTLRSQDSHYRLVTQGHFPLIISDGDRGAAVKYQYLFLKPGAKEQKRGMWRWDVEVRPSFEIGLLIVGIFLSIWWVRHIILPFLYSIYWTVRRWVRWYTPLRYLVGVVASVVVILYLPKVAPYPLRDRFFGFGLAMGIVISIIRVFDKSARLAMRDEFASYMKVQMPIK
jgi:hypothetical protein